MELDNVIRVEVTQVPPGLAADGFGTLLGLVANPAFAGRTKSYFSAAEGATDYPNTQSAERRFLDACFAQSPSPRVVKLGRCNNKPTMVYQISAINPTGFGSTVYTLGVKFANTATTVSFTTDASPTDAEFATALVSALNGIAGKNFTAAGASSPVTVTANAAGDFFAIEVKNRSLMSLEVTHVDPGVAADLTAIYAEDPDFDCVVPTQHGRATVASVAAWCLANKKLFDFDTCETKAVTTATGGSADDAIEDVQVVGNRFASGWFHPDPAAMLAAAVCARVLPEDPGSETWAYKQLEGVAPVALTEGEFTNLKGKYGNTYVAMGSGPNAVRITWDGRTSNGSYIDLQRGVLWMVSVIKTDFFNFIAEASAAGKIGFDAEGRAALEATYKGSCKKGVKRGFVAPDEFTVTMLALEDVPDADRANRHYPDTVIAFRALGAIHSADVEVVMKV